MDASLCESFGAIGCTLIEKLLPRVVLVPNDTESISRLVTFAAEKRLRVCPTGAGSSFPANYSPPDNMIFLLMNQFDQILSLRLGDAMVTVEPGLIVSDMIVKLEGTGLDIPAVLAEYRGTIGGAVLGPDSKGLRHAEMRRRLLSVMLVDSMGHKQKHGANVIKNVAGYDFWSFMVGSNGRFGIITELTLNFEQMPPLTPLVQQEKCRSGDENPAEWIYANLCKVLDPDGIFVR